MTYVKGKDVNFYVYRDEGGDEVAVFAGCALTITKEETAEELNITTADSGRENEYIGGSKDATGTVDGLMTIDQLNRFQYKDFVDNVGNVLHILITYENSFGDRISYDANALVTNVSDSAGATDLATFSVSWKRTGPATIALVGQWLIDDEGNPILDSDGLPIR